MNTYKIVFYDRWDRKTDSICGSRATIKQLWKELAKGYYSYMWYAKCVFEFSDEEEDAVVAHMYCTMADGVEVFLDSMNSPEESEAGEIWLGRFEGVMC